MSSKAEWIGVYVEFDPTAKELTGDLYKNYVAFARKFKLYCHSHRHISMSLIAKGCERFRSGGKKYLIGVRIKKWATDEPGVVTGQTEEII